MTEEIRNRIAKIKALADRGVGGEKENAESLLAKLLAKYNITEEDIVSDEISEHEFSFWGTLGDQLFNQIVYSVLGENGRILHYAHKRNCKTRFVYCTEAQAIEIKEMFEFYRYHLDQGIETYYHAFIQKEEIFPPDSYNPEYELTDKDKEAIKLSKALDKHERRIMIEEHSRY